MKRIGSKGRASPKSILRKQFNLIHKDHYLLEKFYDKELVEALYKQEENKHTSGKIIDIEDIAEIEFYKVKYRI